MSRQKKFLGSWGEKLVKRRLIKRGFKLLASNFRCNFGEIDLIFLYKECLVFVEVRVRSSHSSIQPEETITPIKRQHIIRTALFFQNSFRLRDFDLRFDVVCITVRRWPFRYELRHIEEAFEEEERFLGFR